MLTNDTDRLPFVKMAPKRVKHHHHQHPCKHRYERNISERMLKNNEKKQMLPERGEGCRCKGKTFS